MDHKVCPNCGQENCLSSEIVTDIMHIGDGIHSPKEEVPVQVPLISCSKCKNQFFDSESEDIRDAAYKSYCKRHKGVAELWKWHQESNKPDAFKGRIVR